MQNVGVFDTDALISGIGNVVVVVLVVVVVVVLGGTAFGIVTGGTVVVVVVVVDVVVGGAVVVVTGALVVVVAFGFAFFGPSDALIDPKPLTSMIVHNMAKPTRPAEVSAA
jgi:hypothetical protein